jgi:hypothetical protein
MKKHVRNDHKLTLRKETVRMLSELELGNVGGGDPTTTVIPTRLECPTHVTCPTQRICLTTATTTNP